MSAVHSDDPDYYSTFGPTTDIRAHADRVAVLPSDPASLAEIVRGLLLHDFTAAMNGIAFSPDRDGMRTFGAGLTLDRILQLDSAPLNQQRPQEERLIGYCYHFALVHCALLRAKGVPSRTRCGFANYLIPDKWTDHWVVEHWDGQRWQLNDPQIGLDTLSHDDFHNGVRAWQLCRSGETDPSDHGNGELWGWDELRGSLVNDVGALNKIEVGDWDWCEALKVEPLDGPHAALDIYLDGVASSAAPGRALDAAIRPPSSVGDT